MEQDEEVRLRALRSIEAELRAHPVHAGYTPEATTWVKIKNRQYSQAVGREDFFNRSKAGP